MPITTNNLKVETKDFDKAQIDEVINALHAGLSDNFETVSVSHVNCPDLTQEPFSLAKEGICGRPCLVDIGGVPNLVPLVKRDVYYDLSHLSNWLDMKEGLAIGAGAGPWKYVGVNSELIANFAFGSGTIEKSMSYIAKLDPETEKPIVETLPPGENNCAVLLNLLCSEGKPGKVIKVECKNRKGGLNFVSCMRNAMWKRFPCKFLGLGGVFVIKKGKAKLHIMPDFSEKPLNSDEEVASWLKFVEASSPLTCLSVFVTSDADMDLRVEHTHCFSSYGEGGHYHYDTTPEEVAYEGYFVLGETMYRVDRPTETHQIGRD
ncbi:ester hydrolase C11orf54 homolog isoform X2 [Artemia franciscana]|uniref:ester hydrolase C11orf54 homolog isoform X2 n=1 Tax=Artemia franciscana TaxID=6661 RepID=UPI0032D9DFBF